MLHFSQLIEEFVDRYLALVPIGLFFLTNPGSICVIDDILPQPNWPAGHDLKADRLITALEQRSDLRIVKMSWASGIILAIKKN